MARTNIPYICTQHERPDVQLGPCHKQTETKTIGQKTQVLHSTNQRGCVATSILSTFHQEATPGLFSLCEFALARMLLGKALTSVAMARQLVAFQCSYSIQCGGGKEATPRNFFKSEASSWAV